MAKQKAFWDILSEAEKQTSLDQIIRHFETERDEQIGVIAAEQILDVVLEFVVPAAFNKGLESAKELVQERMTDLSVDLDSHRQ